MMLTTTVQAHGQSLVVAQHHRKQGAASSAQQPHPGPQASGNASRGAQADDAAHGQLQIKAAL